MKRVLNIFVLAALILSIAGEEGMYIRQKTAVRVVPFPSSSPQLPVRCFSLPLLTLKKTASIPEMPPGLTVGAWWTTLVVSS